MDPHTQKNYDDDMDTSKDLIDPQSISSPRRKLKERMYWKKNAKFFEQNPKGREEIVIMESRTIENKKSFTQQN